MQFTVFTPIFYRAYTLNRVYDSLTAQTFSDFEWVIVDNGSTNETRELVKKWRGRSSFPITYIKQENSRKYVVINSGVEVARGCFFLIAGSDDSIFPDALEKFYRIWQEIGENAYSRYTGVSGLCLSEEGDIIGNIYPADICDYTPAETFYCVGIKGEQWGFHRTSVLKVFPFPELRGFQFYPEGLVWNKIGRKYLSRYVNILEDDVDYLFCAPLTFLKISAPRVCFLFQKSNSLCIQFCRLTWRCVKFLWLLAFSIGFSICLIDKVRYR